MVIIIIRIITIIDIIIIVILFWKCMYVLKVHNEQ